jgi:uncharacterized protein (DUF305 family)
MEITVTEMPPLETESQNDDRALEALIKLYKAQVLMAQDTVDKLEELKSLREEITLYRTREVARLNQQLQENDNGSI